jgi:glycosyltransferase involved in cell wall biosynthesis
MHDYEFVSADPLDDTGGRWARDSAFKFRLLNTCLFAVRRAIHSRCVAEWIAVSDYLAAAVHPSGISSTTIYNFVPEYERFSQLPTFEQRAGVTFVGRLSPEKGLWDFLELANRLAPQQFTIAGSGSLHDAARMATESHGNVTFRGKLARSDVLELLRESRVLVCPSHWAEPAPIVALEAMTAGTPVVTYDRGGLAEYIRASGAGVVVRNTIDALELATRNLGSDVGLWSQCSVAGLEASCGLFSQDRAITALEAVYERAISRHRHRRPQHG